MGNGGGATNNDDICG